MKCDAEPGAPRRPRSLRHTYNPAPAEQLAVALEALAAELREVGGLAEMEVEVVWDWRVEKCPGCGGNEMAGRHGASTCPDCDGTGEAPGRRRAAAGLDDLVGRRFEFRRAEGAEAAPAVIPVRELESATWLHADGTIASVEQEGGEEGTCMGEVPQPPARPPVYRDPSVDQRLDLVRARMDPSERSGWKGDWR